MLSAARSMKVRVEGGRSDFNKGVAGRTEAAPLMSGRQFWTIGAPLVATVHCTTGNSARAAATLKTESLLPVANLRLSKDHIKQTWRWTSTSRLPRSSWLRVSRTTNSADGSAAAAARSEHDLDGCIRPASHVLDRERVAGCPAAAAPELLPVSGTAPAAAAMPRP